MDEKFSRRFKSFCNSLEALSEARERDLSDSFVLSGTSAKFSITFDLSWKVMKDILVQYYAVLWQARQGKSCGKLLRQI